jgi:UDP:flavonoid glycosyltransferase YjiC (YdhE family)
VRVLCTSTPMEGVVAPLLPIAAALRQRGHDVVIAVGPDVQARVEGAGFEPVVVGPAAMEAAMRAFGEPAAAEAPGTSPAFAAAMFGGVFASELLPALRRIADEFVPDAIVHPPVEVASPIVAAERGIANVTYGFGQLLDDAIVSALAQRVAPLWESASLAADPHAGIYRDCYLDPCPPSMRLGALAPASVVQAIRPEIPGQTSDVLPAEVAALGGRPIIYVTLGTVPLFNLLATFQMVLDAVATEDLDVVATIGSNNDPAALTRLPENVHVHQWLPLRPLLDLCDAVVCHGGSGTTLAALSAGLPLVILPQGADQFENALACESASVARVFRPEGAEPAAIRAAVRAVVAAGSAERRAARRVADEIAAMPSPFDATAAIEGVAPTG